jgi:hypothetical protein
VFGFSYKKPYVLEVKDTIEILRKIYGSWNRGSFKSQKDVHKKVVGVVYESHPTYWYFTPFVKQVREKSQGCMLSFIDDDVPVRTPMGVIEDEYELVEI